MLTKPPFTVKEFLEKARAAQHDSLHIANDPEAIATLVSIAHKRFLENPSDETRQVWAALQEDLDQLVQRLDQECAS